MHIFTKDTTQFRQRSKLRPRRRWSRLKVSKVKSATSLKYKGGHSLQAVGEFKEMAA